jgi:hypothetical protein
MRISPFTLDEARDAARLASAQQAGAEQELRDTSAALAEAERAYRLALAQERMRLHADEGVAWTATDDVARGTRRVADLRYRRDVAKGVYEAASAALWRHTADRKDVGRFVTWSMHLDLEQRDVPQTEVGPVPTFGGRRAA